MKGRFAPDEGFKMLDTGCWMKGLYVPDAEFKMLDTGYWK
jgi:hypothetical protein